MKLLNSSIPHWTAPNLAEIAHGFFGSRGGVSTGIYASLNAGPGSKDDAAAITENRRRIAAAFDSEHLISLHQVHSPTAILVDHPFDGPRPEADALITTTPGLVITILTADCAPILFFEPEARIIGAAHAGWKGALGGVGEATLDAMVTLGAQRDSIVCAVGPCISRASYEVSAGFEAPFLARDREDARFFSDGRPGHFQFDIAGYVAARLAAAGVARVAMLDEDTYSQPDRFFSYRRSCHLGEPGYGREISLIGVPA